MHRDLKPENIAVWSGAIFVTLTTSFQLITNTLLFCYVADSNAVVHPLHACLLPLSGRSLASAVRTLFQAHAHPDWFWLLLFAV